MIGKEKSNIARFAIYKSENKFFIKVEGGAEREITAAEFNHLTEIKNRCLDNFVNDAVDDHSEEKEAIKKPIDGE